MKVLQVNTVYPNGSTGRITAEIAQYTAQQEHMSYTAQQEHMSAVVVFGIGDEEHKPNLSAVRIGNPLQRKIHAVIRKLFDGEGYASHRATRRLIRLCQKQQIDIVHLHNLHGCYLNLKLWFRYLQKVNLPVIWTLHDCWPLTGHCAHFSYCGCELWKTQCHHCPQQMSYPVCTGFDGSKRNYRLKKKLFSGLQNLTIVTPCQWLQDIVRNSYIRNYPIRVIYNGVDQRKFKRVFSDIKVQYGMENKHLLLAVASDWTQRKGLTVLQQLSEQLDETYQIVILGLSLVQKQALPAKILGFEKVSSTEELCKWYSAAECFVNPTLEDTMPLVNLEALACGTPIVVFNTGGCPEVVTDTCGLVVQKGNVQSLAGAIQQICESGIDYTDACITQASRFAMQNTLDAYVKLYQEVAG